MQIWDYSKINEPSPYGDSIVYELGMKFLDSYCHTIEDWGCGTTYAKRFVYFAKYIGIDGSPSKWVDKIKDLSLYKSSVDGIFMRGVLEHNHNWQVILYNALLSFQKRMVFVIFTPILEGVEDETTILQTNAHGTPDISFHAKDLEVIINSCKSIKKWEYNDLKTETQYGCERIYYLEK